MYANLRVKPADFEAMPAVEVRIYKDHVVVVEDVGDTASLAAAPGEEHHVQLADIPDGGIIIKADF